MKNIAIKCAVLVCLCIFLGNSAKAQQEAMFSQYLFNPLTISPAYSGSHETLRFSLQGRRQWLGINGAPLTGVLSADGVSKDARAGWGVLAGYEKIGLYNTQELHGNYAYRMEMGEGTLSLGIRAGATLYSHRASEAALTHGDDELYGDDARFLVPKMGVGAYYQDEAWFLGISVPNLASHRIGHAFSLNDEKSFVRRHFYAHGGFLYELDEGLALKPSLLLKYVKGAPLQADLNLQLYISNKVGLGLGYRTGDAMTLVVEFFPTAQLRIGYAYDATFSRLRGNGGNAHEITVGYELESNGAYRGRRQMQSIAYF